MKVAVSINEEGKISSHLGKAKIFYVFEKINEKVKFLEKRTTEGNHTNHIIEDIKDCDVIISGKIGDGMFENLKKNGIKPIIEENISNPKEAVEKLV